MSATAMTIQEFVSQLEQLSEKAVQAFQGATDAASLDEARIAFLGKKKGELRAIEKNMGSVPKESIREAGMKLKEVKGAIQQAFEDAQTRLLGGSGDNAVDPKFDATLPGTSFRVGRLHPNTQTINELKDIMGGLASHPPKARKSKTITTTSKPSISRGFIPPVIRLITFIFRSPGKPAMAPRCQTILC